MLLSLLTFTFVALALLALVAGMATEEDEARDSILLALVLVLLLAALITSGVDLFAGPIQVDSRTWV